MPLRTKSSHKATKVISKQRLVVVVTAEMTARLFMLGYVRHLAESGYDVTIVADKIESIRGALHEGGVKYRVLPMKRNPAPLHDFVALIQMVSVLRQIRPTAVIYATPKASLITSLAAWLLQVPIRIYEIWGIRFETANGISWAGLRKLEQVINSLSTEVLANSPSLADKAVELGIVPAEKISVLGHGSSHGVDVKRFSPENGRAEIDDETRSFLDRTSGFTVGFIGRLHPDKGIDTLIAAASNIASKSQKLRVLLVGGNEGMRIPKAGPLHIHQAGETLDVRPYLASMDVLVLMSLREGFPNVVLEAAAMNVPAIVSDATGCRDSVVENSTGLIVPVGDTAALEEALIQMMQDPVGVREMGHRARAFVETHFAQEHVWALKETFLRDALKTERRDYDI